MERVPVADEVPVESTPKLTSLRRWVIYPKSLAVRLWEAFVAVATLLSTALVTIQASFDAVSIWITVLIYLTDYVHCFAILQRLFTAYESRGVLVTRPRSIEIHYLKTTLIPDLLSAIPFELILVGTRSGAVYVAVTRLNRLLRCYSLIFFCCEFPHKH